MLGKIRQQLGPARKRLNDRVQEISLLMQDVDTSRLQPPRAKLVANIEYHSKLIGDLKELTPVDDVEADSIASDIERCTILEMDAREMMVAVNDKINNVLESRDSDVRINIRKMETEKLQREIEKLKVETDYKRAQMDKLKKEDTEKTVQTVKLPRLNLPTFSGKFTDWPSYWDSFTAMIHGNISLSKIDKFKYLMSSLEGDAKDTLLGFNLTGAQYDQAVAHLKDRFDKTEFIIHEYYNELSKIPRCRNKTSELRKSFNFIETRLRSLESIGEDVENNHIVSLIKSKLPEEMNLKLEESRGEGDWTVKRLREVTSKLIFARERSEDKSESTSSPEFFGETLLVKEVKAKCVYCDQSHWSDECQLYKTVEERRSRIKGRCYVCMSDRHQFSECKSEKSCFYCKEKSNHHSSLCPEKFSGLAAAKEEAEFSEELVSVGVVSEEVEFNEEVVTVSVDSQTIMKTATVNIENGTTGRKGIAHVLLDTGAKRTYITLEKAKSLGLQCGPRKAAKFNTFGAIEPSEIYTSNTTFYIRQLDGSTKRINARVCKTITGALTKQNIDFDKYKQYWKDLPMADDLKQTKRTYNLDILLGNDYYDDVMMSEKIEVDKGLYLVKSSFGWMFSGRTHCREKDEVYEDDNLLSMLLQEDEVVKFLDPKVESIGALINKEIEVEEMNGQFRNSLCKNENHDQIKSKEYRFCRSILFMICTAFFISMSIHLMQHSHVSVIYQIQSYNVKSRYPNKSDNPVVRGEFVEGLKNNELRRNGADWFLSKDDYSNLDYELSDFVAIVKTERRGLEVMQVGLIDAEEKISKPFCIDKIMCFSDNRLMQATKLRSRFGNNSQNFKEPYTSNDLVVIIKDKDVPRGRWKSNKVSLILHTTNLITYNESLKNGPTRAAVAIRQCNSFVWWECR